MPVNLHGESPVLLGSKDLGKGIPGNPARGGLALLKGLRANVKKNLPAIWKASCKAQLHEPYVN